jgi:hypothetical protein
VCKNNLSKERKKKKTVIEIPTVVQQSDVLIVRIIENPESIMVDSA